MTAHWARLPYDFLDVVSSGIVNEVKGISRVVYRTISGPAEECRTHPRHGPGRRGCGGAAGKG